MSRKRRIAAARVLGQPNTSREPDCSPHPFEVLAVYALYQNVSK